MEGNVGYSFSTVKLIRRKMAASPSSENLKCLIVDDEPLARREMMQLLSMHPGVTVCGEAASVSEALSLTETQKPDLVFLDIKMPGESGFDYVARVPGEAPRIVFVTAYDQYAVKGFECNAMDYLLKPVKPERLAESLRRARDKKNAPFPPSLSDDVIFIKGTTTGRFASWSGISHILAEGNYSQVHFADGTNLNVLRTLKDWLALAPADFLLQIHRTALVNPQHIREVAAAPTPSRKQVFMQSGAALPVGRSHLGNLRMQIQ